MNSEVENKPGKAAGLQLLTKKQVAEFAGLFRPNGGKTGGVGDIDGG